MKTERGPAGPDCLKAGDGTSIAWRWITAEQVLLIDDEPEFLEVMAERMRILGMEVTTATSAWDALEKMEDRPYDAIVLDLVMPDMDGFEALKAIKEKAPEVPVILLTGHAIPAMMMEARKRGALDLIEKPADLKVLVQKIRDARASKLADEDKDR